MIRNKPDQEIEAKFCVVKPAAIEEKLVNLNAVLVQSRTAEFNLRFDTPDQKLTRSKQILRLRRDSKTRLTYKGPSSVMRGIAARQEIEFEVGDFESAKKFVEALGYKIDVIYEKFRTTYTLDDLIITIDEMPYGPFIEIEGNDIDAIKAMAGKLNLDWEARMSDSYMTLFYRAKKALGLTFRDLTFENFADQEISLDDLAVCPADWQAGH